MLRGSLTVTLELRVPEVVGENVTLMVQLPLFPASELPQLFVCVKLVEGDIAMLLMDSALVPGLVIVMVWGELLVFTFWFPKVRVVGENPTEAAVPVPLRLTACGLPAVALSAILMEAVRVPEAEGVKVTEIVQELLPLPLIPSVLGLNGQPLVSPKSPEFVPPSVTPVMVKAMLPVFVRVIVSGELVVPTV